MSGGEMRKILLLFLVFSMAVPVIGAERKSYSCYLLSGQILLDGKLEDTVWENIPSATGFYIPNNDYAITRQTEVKMGYNQEAIFIGIKCEEPEVKNISGFFKDGENLWMEDSVEIFFMPPDASDCFQFIINTSGARWDGIYKSGVLEQISPGDWKAAVFKGEDYYSMEIMLPFKIFKKFPAKGSMGKIDFCRNTYVGESLPGDKHTSWVPLQSQFYEPQNFGQVIFKGKTGDLKEIQKSEEETNKYFKDFLMKEIKKIRDLMPVKINEIVTLSKSNKDPSLQKEITLLRKNWEEMESFENYYLLSIDSLYSNFSKMHILKVRSERISQTLKFLQDTAGE